MKDPLITAAGKTFPGLRGDHAVTAIKCCTQLLSYPLDPDTLHANLKLCLRLTRQPALATVFTSEGGPKMLLTLTQKSGFRGFSSLVTLLFKHCLEDGHILQHTMESVIRAALTNPFYNAKEIRPQATGGRELYYVMRKLGPCACRNPELFLETACKTIRLCSEPPAPSVYTSTQRIPPTLVKCIPQSKLELGPLNSVQMDLLNLLIDCLCAEDELDSDSSSKPPVEVKNVESKIDDERDIARAMHFDANVNSGSGRRGRVRHGSYRRQVTTGTYDDDDVNSEDMAVDGEETGSSRLTGALGGGTTSSPTDEREGISADKSKDRPLMSKAAILRLLSEIVETYPSCAKVISESSRKVKVRGMLPKDMTVLAFVFDHLLPTYAGSSSGKVPPITKLSKTFIQCLAVSHPSPETISLLVTEFKHALTRALSLPESASKHNRIRALTGLLSQISDYIMAARGALNPSHFARLLIRKGFISDLARAVHNLNLSSSMLPGTINSILKPMEVLTKIVNQVAAAGKKSEGDKSSGGGLLGAGGGTGTSGGASGSATVSLVLRGDREVGEQQLRPVLEEQQEEGHPDQPQQRQLQQQQPRQQMSIANDLSGGGGGGGGSQTSIANVVLPQPEAAGGVAALGEGGAGVVVAADQRQHMLPQQQQQQEGGGQSPLATAAGGLDPSILEAAHESLIPLEEEEEEEEGEEEVRTRSNLIDQVVNLARDLGRSHCIRGKSIIFQY